MPRRVMAPAKIKASGSDSGSERAATGQTQGDSYLARLIKYIPSEIITVYVLVWGFIGTNLPGSTTSNGRLSLDHQQQFLVFAGFLVATPIYTFLATNKKGLPPASAQILISIVSFAAWAFALGGPFSTLDFYPKDGATISAIALPLVVLVAGFIVPKPQQV
jgi:hypothetical protein